MIITQQDVINKIKELGILNFSLISSINEPSVVTIVFNRVHWYSLILKRKIRILQTVFKNETSIGIFWNYKTTSKK